MFSSFRSGTPLVSILVLAGLVSGCNPATVVDTHPGSVIRHYASIAHAGYEDSLLTARELEASVDELLADPSGENLQAAREAWLAARVPYQQTEVFRFGNPIVDEWEGRVNAWPLDEGLIDYTAPAYGTESDNNYFYTANIIANPRLSIGGIDVDAREITPQLLSETLHEIDGVEANVATGYHAIEFLLWGQDLNGTGPGAGERPYTDYSLASCSNGNCERRRDYLKTVSRLLVTDLEEMVANWEPGGAAYIDLMEKGEAGGLATILIGMGSLANAELAVERVRLGLLLNDPEEEHDCFSDNTHNSHYYDVVGIENVYLGRYVRVSGEVLQGPSLRAVIRDRSPEIHQSMQAAMARTRAAVETLVSEAEAGRPYDMLIAPGNTNGEAVITEVVDALIAETRQIESIISELELTDIALEG